MRLFDVIAGVQPDGGLIRGAAQQEIAGNDFVVGVRSNDFEGERTRMRGWAAVRNYRYRQALLTVPKKYDRSSVLLCDS